MSTTDHLRAVTEAVASIPASLPEPFSVTAYRNADPSVNWHVTDKAEFEAIFAYLLTIDDQANVYEYDTGASELIANARTLGAWWSVALLRERVSA